MKTDLQMLILKSLNRHSDPVNTHQLAAEVIMRGGFHPETSEILEAIQSLRAKGYLIADEEGVERRFYLEQPTGGNAA